MTPLRCSRLRVSIIKACASLRTVWVQVSLQSPKVNLAGRGGEGSQVPGQDGAAVRTFRVLYLDEVRTAANVDTHPNPDSHPRPDANLKIQLHLSPDVVHWCLRPVAAPQRSMGAIACCPAHQLHDSCINSSLQWWLLFWYSSLYAAQIFRVARFEPEDEDREPVLFVFQRLETEDDAEEDEEEEEEEEEVRRLSACTHTNSIDASLCFAFRSCPAD